jgi:hypothetical protein
MKATRINILLLFAVTMFTAKPFVGFHMAHLLANDTEATILIKAFTKRKLEFVEDSDFDVMAIQQRLADPAISMATALFFFLSGFFKLTLNKRLSISGKASSYLQLRLFPPAPLYLLSGKLSI